MASRFEPTTYQLMTPSLPGHYMPNRDLPRSEKSLSCYWKQVIWGTFELSLKHLMWPLGTAPRAYSISTWLTALRNQDHLQLLIWPDEPVLVILASKWSVFDLSRYKIFYILLPAQKNPRIFLPLKRILIKTGQLFTCRDIHVSSYNDRMILQAYLQAPPIHPTGELWALEKIHPWLKRNLAYFLIFSC